MDVFWELGYEGATLTGLQEAMGGISAPSFYAAFGSKEARERRGRVYSDTLAIPMMKVLAEEPTARKAMGKLLMAAMLKLFAKP